MKRVLIFALLIVFASVAGIAQDTGHSHHGQQPRQSRTTEKKNTMDHSRHQMAGETEEKKGEMDHGDHQMDEMTDEHQHVHKEVSEEQKKEIGVDEKLDTVIPMDLTFRLEDGSESQLQDIVKLPTLIVPIYFSCPNVCHMLQSAVANVLPQVKLKPGEEYQVLSVSFDETDTPDVARQKKSNYMAAMDHRFPEDQWHFITSDLETVDTFMDAIGFRYKREGRDFIHPVVVVAITPEGKISRYIYGSNFLPFDLTLALTEASAGRSGISVKRIVPYCFSYDPEGKKYVFNLTKVAGTIILLFAVFIFLMLTLGGRKKNAKK